MSDEEAKAVQEIARATGKGIDTVKSLGAFLKEVFGPGLMELGGAFHDWTKAYRYKNLLRLQDKVEGIRGERHNTGKVIPIPPRYALSLLERASLEDNETIQDMWAGLIANASDPDKRLDVKKVYIDILSSLEPLDTAILADLQSSLSRNFVSLLTNAQVSDEELRISLQNLARFGCIRQEKHETWTEMSKLGFDVSDVTAAIVLTDLGHSLLEACQHDASRPHDKEGRKEE